MIIDRYLDRLRRESRRWRERRRLRGRRVDRALAFQVKEDLLLVKPLTYMNRSGLAVNKIVEQFRLKPADCLILYDDLNIPMGELRARAGGGSGGHRGMESIIAELGTEEIPRLRVGIRKEGLQGDLTDYVLGNFSAAELRQLQGSLNHAALAISLFHEGGVERVMREVNRPTPG